MVRLFQVYYPVRTLVLLAGEAIVVCACFLVSALFVFGRDSYLVLNYENGMAKILLVTGFAILCSYYFDLYAPQWLTSRGETYFRLLIVVGVMSFALAAVVYFVPSFALGSFHYTLSLVLLPGALLAWRGVYEKLIRIPAFRERVVVLGAGERAEKLVEVLRSRPDLGMEVVLWAGAIGDPTTIREQTAQILSQSHGSRAVDRIVVAIQDRRGVMPVKELLDLRLLGVEIEDATSMLEKASGKIETEDLYPSSLIFADGFRLNQRQFLMRRIMSILMSSMILLLVLPIIPLVALAIKLSSPGPVLFRQQRVGRFGQVFTIYKFRTMRADAEAKTGAVWAGKNDPRVTMIGRILRKTRLDEIPQLWNVLKGDMAFIGPRPERPEFTQWLNEKVPYYNLRHMIRPGLTGWAQVRYRYGATLDETKEKLKYDLYYIKHISVSLDLLIVFETIKTVLLHRGQ